MGIIDGLLHGVAKLATRLIVKRAMRQRSDRGQRVLSQLFPSGRYGWPGGWSQDRLEQVNHFQHWVYVAIRAIMDKVAMESKNVNVAYIDDNGKPAEDVSQDHPLRRLLNNPNVPDTAWDVWSELTLFMELTGNGYLWSIPNNAGYPAELWTIPSHWVWPRSGKDPDTGEDKLVAYYEIRPWGGLGSAGILRFPPEEVIHFPFKNPLNKLDGYAPLAAAAQWIDTEESIAASRWAQFKNAGRPEMFIELGPEWHSPTDDDISRIEAKFMQKLAGEYNTGRPLVGEPGIKVTPLSLPPLEMAYVQSEDQIRDMILSIFKVPKTVVGILQDVNRAAIDGSLLAFCMFVINPLLTMMGQRLTEKLAWRFADDLCIWWPDCSPVDPLQLNQDIDTDVRANAISIDEIRAIRKREAWGGNARYPMVNGPMGPQPLRLSEGIESDADSDTEIPDEITTPSQQADALGKAGGIAGIVTVLQAVAVGTMSHDSAISTIALFYNVPRDEAARIVGEAVQSPAGASGPITPGEAKRLAKKYSVTGKRLVIQKSKDKYTVAVDLDGTLAEYDGWKGEDVIGDMKPGAQEFMRHLREMDCNIIIWTTRGNTDRVAEWLDENELPYDTINENPDQPEGSSNKVIADIYVDDRAVNVADGWGAILQRVEVARGKSKSMSESGTAGYTVPTEFVGAKKGIPDVRQVDGVSCGASCLTAVASHHGIERTQEEMKSDLGTDADGTDPENILRVARELGLQAEEIEGMDAVEDACRNGRLVIASVKTAEGEGHYVVVTGVSAKSVFVHDSLAGAKRIGKKLFAERWNDSGNGEAEYKQYGISIGRSAERNGYHESESDSGATADSAV